ncbi:MAG: PAS domain S-box protein [Pseudomonadota bacterium]
MKDEEKSKKQLISELIKLRRRVEELDRTSRLEYSQAKETLKSSEDRYRIILESVEEAYFELDLAGNVTFFNKATSHMLGYTPDELMGMNYRDYVPPESTNRLFKIYNKIYRTGKPAEIFDYQIIRKDGTRRFREMSASLIRDPSQDPIGFRCLARDVTKRKLDEEALKKRDKELEIKSRSLAESNTALKVLLKQREEDKVELERNVLSNVREIIIPYIEELKRSRLTANQSVCINTIETNVTNIISPFLRNITLKHFNLTPKEFQVANLVKQGRTTKEIADFLGISTGAIDFHRNSIRKKMGLNNKKANLRFYLLSLS